MRRWPLRSAVPAAAVAAVLLAGCAGPPATSPGDRTGPPSTTTCRDGWTVLLDASADSFGAWRQAGPGSFERQDDGTVRTRGGLGLLWHPLALGVDAMESYRLEVTWQVAGDDNSGVFVGFPDPGGDPAVAVEQGYEVQIDATDDPDRTTGALYAVAAPEVSARDAALRPPGSWNTFAVDVGPQRLTVRLNGTEVTDHRVDGGPVPAAPGHVGLQNHGDGDDVRFGEVRVRPLAAGVPSCPQAVP